MIKSFNQFHHIIYLINFYNISIVQFKINDTEHSYIRSTFVYGNNPND